MLSAAFLIVMLNIDISSELLLSCHYADCRLADCRGANPWLFDRPLKVKDWEFYLSLSAPGTPIGGWIRTLDLGMMIRVFNHCATSASLVKNCLHELYLYNFVHF
jgi:hypothetical protein